MQQDIVSLKGNYLSNKRMASALADGIRSALETGSGFLAGRFGTIEFEVCWEHYKTGKVSSDAMIVLERNAGVFPSNLGSVMRWVEATRRAIQVADVMATGWYAPIVKKEQLFLDAFASAALKQIPLRGLEPYYESDVGKRWSQLLAGQKVCVVSSFTDTAAAQVAKGAGAIWPGNPGILEACEAANCDKVTSVEWSWVKTGYSPCMSLGRAAWECDAESWKDAVDYVVKEVDKTGARIILIGCGGLGMVIAAALKERGKICIVMGGAIQVFFGIKGRRWENHEFISKLWNENWVYPSLEETPRGALAVERGCYW